jgi:hypothetical protein
MFVDNSNSAQHLSTKTQKPNTKINAPINSYKYASQHLPPLKLKSNSISTGQIHAVRIESSACSSGS